MFVKPPRRVLHLDPAGQLWGSEQSLLLLLKHIDRREFQPFLCLPRHSQLADKAREIDIPCFVYFRDKLHRAPRFSPRKVVATFGLIRVAHRVKPDLIHLNQAGAIRYVLLLHKFFPCPIIVHVRLAEDAALLAKRLSAGLQMNLIANSKFVYNKLIDHGIRPRIVHCVYNPIDLSIPKDKDRCVMNLKPKDLNRIATNQVVGFVGRISEDKGIQLFLRAMQEVFNKRLNTIGIVIGDSAPKKANSEKDYLVLMKELASQLGIADRVMFLGFREDARWLMQCFDVFVLASDEEPWGRVICESLIAGTPVVATDAGGAREIVQSGTSGLLVPPRNSNALAEAVIQLLDSPDLGQQMVLKGREWVRKNCDPKRHAEAVMEIYRSL